MLVLVLAGGLSRRMGGGDKTRLVVGDASLLDHVLVGVAELAPSARCVVVGEPRPLSAAATVGAWAREEPAGSGPVAAVAAGLAVAGTDAGSDHVSGLPAEVALLAGDAPLAPRALPRLRAALDADPSAGVALLVDGEGRRQHLAAVWRGPALVAALAVPGRRSLRALLDGVRVLDVPARGDEARDCDDPDGLAELRRRWEGRR